MEYGTPFKRIDLESNETDDEEEEEEDEEEKLLKENNKLLSEQKLFFGTVESVFSALSGTYFILMVLDVIICVPLFLYYLISFRLPPQKLGDMFGQFFTAIACVQIVWFVISGFMCIMFSSRWFKWKYLMVLIGIILPVSIYVIYIAYPILDEEFPNDQYSVYMIVLFKFLCIPTVLSIAVFLLAYYKTIKINNSLYIERDSSKKIEEGKQW